MTRDATASPDPNPIPETAGTAAATSDGASVPRGSERDALEALKERGFTASFVANDGALRLAGGTRSYPPEELAVRAYQRFEGVSDPDDMSIVYAIETKDGVRGTLVDAFGVYANPAVTAVMEQVTAECEGLPDRLPLGHARP